MNRQDGVSAGLGVSIIKSIGSTHAGSLRDVFTVADANENRTSRECAAVRCAGGSDGDGRGIVSWLSSAIVTSMVNEKNIDQSYQDPGPSGDYKLSGPNSNTYASNLLRRGLCTPPLNVPNAPG